jgi:2'-N-acetylparomamine deacetylase / 2'''-acetyl-6'''-hydroxyneomycin deacetylase
MGDPQYVFLSPHPDDVALSLGSICGTQDRQLHYRLITVFSKTDWLGPNEPRDAELASKIREVEDVEFARTAAMERVDLGFSDFPLRTGRPVDQCMSASPDATGLVVAALLQMKWEEGTTVLAPAGVGNHVDHLTCRDAAVELGRQAGVPVLFYCDMPYSIRPGLRPGPAHTLVPGDGEAWFRSVKCYPSQARLVRETVELVGHDGAPVMGAYLTNRA